MNEPSKVTNERAEHEAAEIHTGIRALSPARAYERAIRHVLQLRRLEKAHAKSARREKCNRALLEAATAYVKDTDAAVHANGNIFGELDVRLKSIREEHYPPRPPKSKGDA